MTTQGTVAGAATSKPNPLDALTLSRIRAGLHGALITPGHAEYDLARKVYNGMIDRCPAAIIQCVDASDVMLAVNVARDSDRTLSVRGGSHNPNGFAVCDDGVVIDLSQMRNVRVDPAAMTACVEGGATWGDFDQATHAHGLGTTGGIVSSTGVGGLTLGGGIGHLTRKHGLSCDNLISAEVVLASGAPVKASATENADLFWAIRGGGGNFGVVTSFEFKLHRVGTVLGGPVLYPLEKTRDVLRFYRDYIASAPREMNAFFAILIVPPGPPFPPHLQNTTVCAIVGCYAGDAKAGQPIVQPLRDFGPPLLDLLGPVPYPALQGMFDPLLPAGMLHYWKADFVDDLRDEAIDAHARFGPRMPNVSSAMHIYPISGAVQDVAQDATAFEHRRSQFVHVIAAMYNDATQTPKNVAWVRDYWSALHPFSARAAYVNFMMDEGEPRIRATYGANYNRLAALKKKYDPKNLFHMNQNIKPAP